MRLIGFSRTKYEYWTIQCRRTDVTDSRWFPLKHYDDLTDAQAQTSIAELRSGGGPFEYQTVRFEYDQATGKTESTFVDGGYLSSL
jgi:hypothetical protein